MVYECVVKDIVYWELKGRKKSTDDLSKGIKLEMLIKESGLKC